MSEQDDERALSPMETIVGEIWMEALQLEKINPDDNFFGQGGDSLTTMMMLFRVGDLLNVDVPPDVLMDAPTLREFCRAIDSGKSTHNAADTSEISVI